MIERKWRKLWYYNSMEFYQPLKIKIVKKVYIIKSICGRIYSKDACETYVCLYPCSYIGLYVNKAWGKVMNVLKGLKVEIFKKQFPWIL